MAETKKLPDFVALHLKCIICGAALSDGGKCPNREDPDHKKLTKRLK